MNVAHALLLFLFLYRSILAIAFKVSYCYYHTFNKKRLGKNEVNRRGTQGLWYIVMKYSVTCAAVLTNKIEAAWNAIYIYIYIYKVPHHNDVIMGAMSSQITSLTIVYSTVYSDADQRRHQSSAPLAFARGIHRWPVNSRHKGPVTRKKFPFDDVIMRWIRLTKDQ